MIVDASVALKWYLAEDLSDQAEALFAQQDLSAPELIIAEVGNALWKAWRRDVLASDVASAAMDNLGDRFSSLHALAPLSLRAANISRQLDHPIYDCFYLACAEQVREQLVTADQRLVNVTAGTEFAPLVHLLA